MTTLIKLFYAVATMSLLILVLAFGVRTFYGAPKAPEYPRPPNLGRPVVPPPPGAGVAQPLPVPGAVTDEEMAAYEEAQRQYQEAYEADEDRRADYHRNVFLIASISGILCAAGGVVITRRNDAIGLGLLGGGAGLLLYGVIQAADDVGRFGPEIVFIVALVGLIVILGTGFRSLGDRG
jgi:hypothetical protein